MAKLFQNPDGSNHQARAVLAYLQSHDGIESSWNNEIKQYLAEPEVNRWHNCREQGYVISMRGGDFQCKQINIVFYEHRNSDSICALMFEGSYVNPPTIDNLPEDVYKDKYDYTHSVEYGKPAEMAEWIIMQLTNFYQENLK